MNKKGEWTASNYVISLVLLSAIIAIAYVMVGGLATDYGASGVVDSKFSERYDRFNNQTSRTAEMWNATNSDKGFSILNAADAVFQAGLTVVTLIFGSMGTLKEQVGYLAEDFGIPTPIFNVISVLFITIISILIIFSVINWLNKQGKL